MKKILFSLLFIVFFTFSCLASHVPGGNITYQCVGPNTYVVTLTLFEDCGTAFETNGPEPITISNNCGLSFGPTINLPNIAFQSEVSQLCLTNLPQSECNGGTLPGVYMHVWQDTITLPGPCDSWTFSYSSCCRNQSNNLVGTGNNYYWESVLNSTTAPCNTSPVITSQPIPYYCVNQPVVYNFGAYEPDGHTLVYSLVNALTGAGTSAPYAAGFSGPAPIAGVTIDPNTGEIQFTPTVAGNYVFAVLIEEFDAAGNLVGSIMQDFQFEIISTAGCANNNPSPPASGISNFISNGVQTGPNQVQLCEGDNVCFDVEFTDASTDSIYLSSNVDQLFPGATIVQNSYFSPASATICFLVGPGSNPLSTITIDAQDNACPIVGISSMSVGVTVVSSTYAGQDVIMCQGVGTQLSASGGSNFTWSVISGDPINIGTNFSCNNCQDPIANPSITTVYEVTSNLSGGCTNIDTVEVTVVPDFTYSVLTASTSSCLMEDIGFSALTSPNVGFTYLWTPSTDLSSTTIFNPIFSPSSPGTFDFTVTITSPDGCVHQDTVSVNVSSGVAPSITAFTTDTLPFCSSTVTLWGEVDTSLVSAGISDDFDPTINMSMWSSLQEANAGAGCGANSGTNALHFGGTSGTRFAATVGFNTAPCSTIDFCLFLGNSLSGGSPCENCDAGDDVDLEFSTDGGLTWNLIQTYAHSWWDAGGQYSNTWACFSVPIPPLAISSNTMFRWYQTPTAGGIATTGYDNWSLDDVQVTCSTIGNYVYEWTPSNGIVSVFNDTTLLNTPSSPGLFNYNIIVTDTVGNCSDTGSVSLFVLCDTCVAPIPTITPVTCYGGNDGAVTAQPFGIDGPPWTLQLLDPITTATILSDTNVITTTTFTGLTAGDYIVRSIDTTGCYADTLINIPQPPQMTLTVSNDTIICIGGSAVLTATGSGGITPYSYNWVGITGNGPHAVSPAISNYYVVNAIDSLGCTSAVDSILVAINPPILISPSAEDTVCPGDMGTLSVLANGGQGGTYNYIWTDAQGGQVGNSSSLDIIPGSGPSVYYVSVTDNCETPAAIDSLSIHWYQEPQVNFLTTGNTGCYPVEAAFTNSTPSNQVLSCLWNFGDGSSSAVCGTVDHLYNTPGSYSVSLTVTSPEGCVNDTTMVDIVEVYDYPTAQFDASPNPADVLNPEVDFQDLSSLDVVGFDWSFMDGNSLLGTSSQQNPTYVFPDNAPGVYEVELIVVNADGCEDEISLQVVVNGVFTCYVPTAFTPDGDGLNDLFYVEGESIDVTNFTFRVFNRWGEKVFETDDINSSWDGRYKNAPAQQDIYIWKVETKDVVTGELKEFMGHVTLMR